MESNRRSIGIGLLFLAIAHGTTMADRPVRDSHKQPKLKVGKDTTVVDGPLRKDGTIDYAAALDAIARKGVTKDNNAAPLIIRALGPDFASESIAQSHCKRLGVAMPPQNGTYFTRLAWRLDDEGLVDVEIDKRLAIAHRCGGELWTAKECPWLAKWLTDMREPLALFERASRKPRLYFPIGGHEGNELHSALIIDYASVRDVGRAFTCRAMLRLGAGDAQGAVADCLVLYRLGRLIGQEPRPLLQLMSISMETLARRPMAMLARSDCLSSQQKIKLATTLHDLPSPRGMSESFHLYKRFVALQQAQAVYVEHLDGFIRVAEQNTEEDEPQLPIRKVDAKTRRVANTFFASSYDVNAAMMRVNHWFDAHCETSKIKQFEQRDAAFEGLYQQMRKALRNRPDLNPLTMMAKLIAEAEGGDADDTDKRIQQAAAKMRERMGGGIGDMLGSHSVVYWRGWQRTENQSAMLLDLIRVTFALEAYRSDQGAYPRTLNALAPKYLPTVPMDLFVGKPLRYLRDGDAYKLYSVGDNMRDDGGTTSDDEPLADLMVEWD